MKGWVGSIKDRSEMIVLKLFGKPVGAYFFHKNEKKGKKL